MASIEADQCFLSAVVRSSLSWTIEWPVMNVAAAQNSTSSDSVQPEATFESHVRLCSDWSRWVLPGVLMLISPKRALCTATSAGLPGTCARYSGRSASVTWQAPRHRPLPHNLDWWSRPGAGVQRN